MNIFRLPIFCQFFLHCCLESHKISSKKTSRRSKDCHSDKNVCDITVLVNMNFKNLHDVYRFQVKLLNTPFAKINYWEINSSIAFHAGLEEFSKHYFWRKASIRFVFERTKKQGFHSVHNMLFPWKSPCRQAAKQTQMDLFNCQMCHRNVFSNGVFSCPYSKKWQFRVFLKSLAKKKFFFGRK